jgi:hypothetical protein
MDVTIMVLLFLFFLKTAGIKPSGGKKGREEP